MAVEATQLLRDGLLRGVSVAVGCAPPAVPGGAAAAVLDAARALGAEVAAIELASGAGPEADEAAVQAALAGATAEVGSLDALVLDAAALFGDGGAEGLLTSTAVLWNAARAAAQAGMLESGGRIVLLAPAAGRPFSAPAAAALENLARTLSIEWARFAITTVAVAPGGQTAAAELAALACWLLSPAGAYFSGCLMDLRGP